MSRALVIAFQQIGRSGDRSRGPPGAGEGRNARAWIAPVLALALLTALFAVGSVAISSLIGPKRYNRASLDSYECGIQPTPQPVGGGKFPVKYYITAMLFIVFDIEIDLPVPVGGVLRRDEVFGLVEMVLFIATVLRRYAHPDAFE